MKYKSPNRMKKNMVITALMAAAALSLTSKRDIIPKDKLYANTTYENTIPAMSLIRNDYTSYLPYYSDILDNTADSLVVMKNDYNTLDSLLKEARTELQVPLVYANSRVDSLANSAIDSLVDAAVNRPISVQEDNVNSILDTISSYTEVVSKDFVKASIKEESGYDRFIVSDMGARGLMQFTKWAWKRFGEGSYLPNVFDAKKNIVAGIKYYKWMEEEFSKKHPNWDLLTVKDKRDLLAGGYNGGPYRLMDKSYKVNWNMKKMPQQSIDHAYKIYASMEQFRSENLFKNIALYRSKVDRYRLLTENTFWLAINNPPNTRT